MEGLSPMADFPHWITEKVRFSETDQMGHVNNTVFGIYFEIGRTTYFCDCGFYQQTEVALVIVKTEIHFRGMIFWPGMIEVGSRVTGVGRSSFSMEQILLQDRNIVGSAISTLVVIDPATSKSAPIPGEIRTALMMPA